MLRLATVFSGIGAIEHALDRLEIPYELVFACDNGERKSDSAPNHVEATYKANFPIRTDRFFQDARKLDGRQFEGAVDLFVGGSPCQSFSVAGKRGGLEEARGTLFYEYARLVSEIKPKVFIYENVTGMLNHDKGRTWRLISEIFDQVGYKWTHFILNAKDFGLPQNRRRVFVVGFRKLPGKMQEPKKQKLTVTMRDLLEETVPNKYYLPEKGFVRVIDPAQTKHVALNGKIARCQVANQQFNWYGDMRFETDIPPHIENDDRIHKGEYKGTRGVARCLTPRECLRLMGFSDDFRIVVPDQYMYKQAGNTIAVNVLQELYNEIAATGVFKQRAPKKLRVATLFSGIGSPEFALKRANIPHKVVFACDNGEVELPLSEEEIKAQLSKLPTLQRRKNYIKSLIPAKKINFVKKSYLANYPLQEKHYHFDVRFFEGEEYRDKVDLLIGGSPCQSFTLLGYQKGLEEARGTLFYDFARIVKEVQPKAFIYENVQGLLKHDSGKTWAVVQRVFDSLGYKLHDKILDAVNYGIPQKRRRIFIVGFKDENAAFEFPPESELRFTMQDFLLENTAEGGFGSRNGHITLARGEGEVPAKYFLSDKIIPGIMSAGTGGFSMPPEIDLPIARPLMSTMHKMHRAGGDNYVTTNGRMRRLAPREALRLMGFTDDFEIAVSDTQMYRQAGNAMVVDVLIGLIREVVKCI